jgi:hypothetical protein
VAVAERLGLRPHERSRIGELRDDLDVDLVTDILMGAMITKVITSGGDLKDLASLSPRVFDVLAAGIGTGRRVG